MFGLSSGALIGLAVGALAIGATAFASGVTYGKGEVAAQQAKAAGRLADFMTRDRVVSLGREVNLWTMVGDERRARRDLIEMIETIDQASADARARMMGVLRDEKAKAAAAETEAREAIERLNNAKGELAAAWKDGRIPSDITCGVFNGKGCPEPSYPSTGPDRDSGLEVRDPG